MAYTALWLEDDASDIPAYLPELSRHLNISFLYARDAEEALVLAGGHAIDVFLLDIEIVGEHKTGIFLADRLREIPAYRATPILFISQYTYHSRRLTDAIRNCRFLEKPYTVADLERSLCFLLGIYQPEATPEEKPMLIIPVKRDCAVEVDPDTICCMEFQKGETLHIQFYQGHHETLHIKRGALTFLLQQIEDKRMTALVQIHRSVIVNVNQIKKLELNGHQGDVYLFNDPVPKPLGPQYRKNLERMRKG